MKASHTRGAMALAQLRAMKHQRVLPPNAWEDIMSFDSGSSCRRAHAERRARCRRLRAGSRRSSADDAYQSWNRLSEQMPQARTICASDRSRHPLCRDERSSRHPLCRDHDILFVV